MWVKENMPGQLGKTVIVTGANAGVGFETALAFYERGAHVVLACRDASSAKQAATQMQETGGTGTLETALLDLASIASIKAFAEEFTATHAMLDILINNAGVMIPPASTTAEGFEMQFGVNFLGHFALTGYLYPVLKITPGSRVITVSSMAYLRGSIDFDNLRLEKPYEPMPMYCQSKLGNILFSLELQRRIEAAGDSVTSIAVQPGANKTSLSRHMSQEQYAAAVQRVGGVMEPWQGALPSLYAATMPNVKGGELWEPNEGGYRGYPAKGVIAPHALNETLAKKLWQFAEEAAGASFL